MKNNRGGRSLVDVAIERNRYLQVQDVMKGVWLPKRANWKKRSEAFCCMTLLVFSLLLSSVFSATPAYAAANMCKGVESNDYGNGFINVSCVNPEHNFIFVRFYDDPNPNTNKVSLSPNDNSETDECVATKADYSDCSAQDLVFQLPREHADAINFKKRYYFQHTANDGSVGRWSAEIYNRSESNYVHDIYVLQNERIELIDNQTVDITNASVLQQTLNGQLSLIFVLELTQNVTVSGTPTISATVNGQSINANYYAGSGSNTLKFEHSVAGSTAAQFNVTIQSLQLSGANIEGDLRGSKIPLNPALNQVTQSFSVVKSGGANLCNGTDIRDYGNGFKNIQCLSPVDNFIYVRFYSPTNNNPKGRISPNDNGETDDCVATKADYSDCSTTDIDVELPRKHVDSTNYAKRYYFQHTAANGKVGRWSAEIYNDSEANYSFELYRLHGGRPEVIPNEQRVITSLRVEQRAMASGKIAIVALVGLDKSAAVTGSPKLSMSIDGQAYQATYSSGSGSNLLTFRSAEITADQEQYTVNVGLFNLNGGTIGASYLGQTIPLNPAFNDLNTEFTLNKTDRINLCTEMDTGYGAVNCNGNNGFYRSSRLDEARQGYNSRYYIDPNDGRSNWNTCVSTDENYNNCSEETLDLEDIGWTEGSKQRFYFQDRNAQGQYARWSFYVENLKTCSNCVSYNKVTSYRLEPVPGQLYTLQHEAEPAANWYKVNDVISFKVKASSGVEFVYTNGKPRLALDIGGTTKYADLDSTSSGGVMQFSYTLDSGLLDSDGITIQGFELNGADIADRIGNQLNTQLSQKHLPGVKVDSAPASQITNASFDNSGQNSYRAGWLDIKLTFSSVITVSGQPVISLNSGANAKAVYLTGSGTTELTFRYEITAGENGTGDNVSVLDYSSSNALTLAGGSITRGSGIDADLTLPAVGGGNSLSATPVRIDTTEPTITNVSIPNQPMKLGDTVTAVITVSSDDDTLVLGMFPNQIHEYTLTNLNKISSSTYEASFLVTSSAVELSASDDIPVMIQVVDRAGNESSFFDQAIAQNNDPIYLQAPVISLSSNKVELSEERETAVLTVSLTDSLNNRWPEDIEVSLATSGSAAKGSDYKLPTKVTIVQGQSTAQVDLGTIDNNVVESESRNVIVTLAGPSVGSLSPNKSIDIDIIDDDDVTPPTIAAIKLPNDGTYDVNQTLSFTVDISESVIVDSTLGSPSLEVVIGDQNIELDYERVIDRKSLVFSKVLPEGLFDSDGISVAALKLNQASIKDLAKNPLDLTLPNVGGLSAVLVNSTPVPQVVDVTSDEVTGWKGVTKALSIAVNFSHEVTVVGNPQLALNLVNKQAFANYVSGSGTTQLLFTYVVEQGDEQRLLNYSAVNALNINGGQVTSQYEKVANLLLPQTDSAESLAGYITIGVDGVSPLAASAPKQSAHEDSLYTFLPKAQDNLSDIRWQVAEGEQLPSWLQLKELGSDQVSTLAGNTAASEDGDLATANFDDILGIAVDRRGNLIISEGASHKIRKLSSTENKVSTLSGSQQGFDNGAFENALFSTPSAIAFDSLGNMYIADSGNHLVRKVDVNNQVTTYAGSGVSGDDTGSLLSASFAQPVAIAIASDDTLFVLDKDNNNVKKITSDGMVTEYVSGLSQPQGMIVDAQGVLYIANTGAQNIVKVDTQQTLSVIAGGANSNATSKLLQASFDTPVALVMEQSGDLLVIDQNLIRRVSLANDSVTVYAGGQASFADGALTDARFIRPTSIVLDNQGYLYVADQFRIRRIDQKRAVLQGKPRLEDKGDNMVKLAVLDEANNKTEYSLVIDVDVFNRAPQVDQQQPVLMLEEDTAESLTLTASDLENEVLNWRVKTLPNHGSVSGGGSTGEFSYSAEQNYYGDDNFIVAVEDGTNSTPVTVNVQISPVNDAPVINIPASLTLDEDTLGVTQFNYTDVDGDRVTGRVSIPATQGQVTITEQRIQYQPESNFFGEDSFTLELTDQQGWSQAYSISVYVTSIDDLFQVQMQESITIDEETSYRGNIVVSDVEGDSVQVAVLSGTQFGELSVDNSSIVYQPSKDFAGADQFTLRFVDQNQVTLDKQVNIEVTNINDLPVVDMVKQVNVKEDSVASSSIDVTDVDGDNVQISLLSSPEHGEVSYSNSSFTYAPFQDYFGSDEFVLQFNDGNGGKIVRHVDVLIESVNDAPVITLDSFLSLEEDSTAQVNFSFTDVDGDSIRVSGLSKPQNGTLRINGESVEYIPNRNFYGSDRFTLAFLDGDGGDVRKEVSVEVLSVNDIPTINGAPALQIMPEQAYSFTPSAADADGDELTFSASGLPTWLSLDTQTGSVTGTPSEADVGTTDAITLSVSDGELTASLPAFSIVVSAIPNAAPTISGTPATSITQGQAYSFTPSAADEDGDELTFSASGLPAWLSLNTQTGSITGTPSEADVGTTAAIILSVTDGKLTTSLAAFSIEVKAQNKAPQAVADSATIQEDTAITLDVLSNDTDADGDTLQLQSVAMISGEANVSAEQNAVRFTPSEHAHGEMRFSYQISDGTDTATAEVVITVTAVNDAPQAVDDTATVSNRSTVNIDVLANDTDVDGDSLSLSAATAERGSVSIDNGILHYTPIADGSVSDTITYHISDGELTAEGQVTVTINLDNQVPIAEDDVITLDSNQFAVTLDVLANDTDADGDSLTLIDVSTSIGLAAIENNQVSLVLPAAFSGAGEVNYQISDGFGGVASAVIRVEKAANQSINLTVPDDITVNAQGLMTRVDVGVASATDNQGNTLAVELMDDTLLAPGAHQLTWKACLTDDNCEYQTQTVNITPQVSTIISQTVVEGNQVQVPVTLNGEHHTYPVVVPVTLSGTANSDDFTTTSTEVVIDSGTQGVLLIDTVNDLISDSDETIIVTLTQNTEASLNLGDNLSHMITISESNLAPVVSQTLTQGGEQRSQITSDGGLVTVQAVVTDANAEDTHQVQWLAENLNTVEQTDAALVFDPVNMSAGMYHISYSATDNQGAVDVDSLNVKLLAATPELDPLTDTDGDGISDAEEGFADTDGDGIPDYLDQFNDDCSQLPSSTNSESNGSFAIAAEGGVCMGLGSTAMSSGGGALLSDEEIAEQLPTDEGMQFTSGVYDFTAKLAGDATSLRLVIPMNAPLPEGAVYRKLINDSWVNFESSQGNAIDSIAGEQGVCPSASAEGWHAGLSAGHWCIRLTIVDGGDYDTDGLVNGTVVDPGGIAIEAVQNAAPVAVADSVEIETNQSIELDVLANDTDSDGNQLMIVAATAKLGTVSIVDAQRLTYTPPADFTGSDSIEYTISDGQGATANTSVTVAVNAPPANQAPQLVDDVAETLNNQSVTIDVLNNDSDPDGDSLTLTDAQADWGNVTIDNNLLVWSPVDTQTGTVNIAYTVSDSNGATVSGTVVLTVKAQPVPPPTKPEVNKSGGSYYWILLLLALAICFSQYQYRRTYR